MGESQPKSPSCLICLQENADEYFLPCNCRLLLHVGCWDQYCNTKKKIECLICHKVFLEQKEIKGRDGLKSCYNAMVCCCCSCLITGFLIQFL